MKVFLSYRFTGEDPKVLKETLQNICDSLKKAGHTYFCSFWKGDFFKDNKYSNKQILNYVLKELDSSDIYLALIKSEDKSEGILIEAGYALAKGKKFYLAIKKGVYTTFMKEIADKVIEFEDIEELCIRLRKLS
jgi:nucleoside 2-deoxyribosyltransferase